MNVILLCTNVENIHSILTPQEASQERFLDVSDILRDVPEDLIFEDEEEGDIWDHEARFIRQTDGALSHAPHSAQNLVS